MVAQFSQAELSIERNIRILLREFTLRWVSEDRLKDKTSFYCNFARYEVYEPNRISIDFQIEQQISGLEYSPRRCDLLGNTNWSRVLYSYAIVQLLGFVYAWGLSLWPYLRASR